MLPGPTFVKTFLRTYAEALGPGPAAARRGVPGDLRVARRGRAPAAARARRRGARRAAGAGRPRRAGPWLAIGWSWWRVVGALLVIGLRRRRRRGRRRGRAERAGTDDAAETTEPQPKSRAAEPRAHATWSLRIAPTDADLRVRRHAAPAPTMIFEGTLDAPQTFRGRRLRVNLGKTDVQAAEERQAGAVEPGPTRSASSSRPRLHQAAAARRAALRLMAARAGIVVTGTEVLTGRVRDRNGPWLSDRLLELGVELAHITICGDRPEDMKAQLRFMADQGVDLVDHERRARARPPTT